MATPSPASTTDRAKRTAHPSPDLLMKLREAQDRVLAHYPHYHRDPSLFTWARLPVQKHNGLWKRMDIRIPVERFWPHGTFPPELLRFM